MARKNHRPAVQTGPQTSDEPDTGDATEPGVVKATVYLDAENVAQAGLPLDHPLRLRIDYGHPGGALFAATVIVEE